MLNALLFCAVASAQEQNSPSYFLIEVTSLTNIEEQDLLLQYYGFYMQGDTPVRKKELQQDRSNVKALRKTLSSWPKYQSWKVEFDRNFLLGVVDVLDRLLPQEFVDSLLKTQFPGDEVPVTIGGVDIPVKMGKPVLVKVQPGEVEVKVNSPAKGKEAMEKAIASLTKQFKNIQIEYTALDKSKKFWKRPNQVKVIRLTPWAFVKTPVLSLDDVKDKGPSSSDGVELPVFKYEICCMGEGPNLSDNENMSFDDAMEKYVDKGLTRIEIKDGKTK